MENVRLRFKIPLIEYKVKRLLPSSSFLTIFTFSGVCEKRLIGKNVGYLYQKICTKNKWNFHHEGGINFGKRLNIFASEITLVEWMAAIFMMSWLQKILIRVRQALEDCNGTLHTCPKKRQVYEVPHPTMKF